MSGITFDTGALIALERNKSRARAILRTTQLDGLRIYVPSVCVGEWWRGRTDRRDAILAAVVVVHTNDALLKAAGEALAIVSVGVADALVMATAARVAPVVFTSDVGDLVRLQRVFPAVRVLAV